MRAALQEEKTLTGVSSHVFAVTGAIAPEICWIGSVCSPLVSDVQDADPSVKAAALRCLQKFHFKAGSSLWLEFFSFGSTWMTGRRQIPKAVEQSLGSGSAAAPKTYDAYDLRCTIQARELV